MTVAVLCGRSRYEGESLCSENGNASAALDSLEMIELHFCEMNESPEALNRPDLASLAPRNLNDDLLGVTSDGSEGEESEEDRVDLMLLPALELDLPPLNKPAGIKEA